MKHLNPRQGITIVVFWSRIVAVPDAGCETPKSPPGDYNSWFKYQCTPTLSVAGVKHLNPRQGITIKPAPLDLPARVFLACETPKSPPGDYNRYRFDVLGSGYPGPEPSVKHLNPRQGITIGLVTAQPTLRAFPV